MDFNKFLMSDKKRYGIKYTIGERISNIVFIGGGITAIVFSLMNWDDTLHCLVFAAMALWFAWVIQRIDIGVLKRRIRELGGDTFHKDSIDGNEVTHNR
jgi:hypothetical protein